MDINTAIETIMDSMNLDETIITDAADLDLDDVKQLRAEAAEWSDSSVVEACDTFISHPCAEMPHLI